MRIEADISRLEQAAYAARGYAETHKRQMQYGDNLMQDLMTSWKGSDAPRYTERWRGISDSTSVSAKMILSMDRYADCLQQAANAYRAAKQTAADAARLIPYVY